MKRYSTWLIITETNQNHNEVLLYIIKMVTIKKKTKLQALAGI